MRNYTNIDENLEPIEGEEFYGEDYYNDELIAEDAEFMTADTGCPYDEAAEYIYAAIDKLAECGDDEIAQQCIADLSVVLLTLQAE